VFRSDGAVLFKKTTLVSRDYSIDLSFLKSGKYFVRVKGEKTVKQGFILLK
jgi:hypothetical protein